jgi:hypothetical protein
MSGRDAFRRNNDVFRRRSMPKRLSHSTPAPVAAAGPRIGIAHVLIETASSNSASQCLEQSGSPPYRRNRPKSMSSDDGSSRFKIEESVRNLLTQGSTANGAVISPRRSASRYALVAVDILIPMISASPGGWQLFSGFSAPLRYRLPASAVGNV